MHVKRGKASRHPCVNRTPHGTSCIGGVPKGVPRILYGLKIRETRNQSFRDIRVHVSTIATYFE
eukprot:scaffold663_cov341-Pavlova_lutheri.AAC.8